MKNCLVKSISENSQGNSYIELLYSSEEKGYTKCLTRFSFKETKQRETYNFARFALELFATYEELGIVWCEGGTHGFKPDATYLIM